MKVKIIIFGLLLYLLSSCSEDFLSSDNTEYLGESRKEELLKDPVEKAKIVKAEVEAVYTVLRKQVFNGNTAHDFFGLKAIQLATDITGEDIVQHAHHWFGYDYNFDNRNDSYRRTSLMWAMFYKMVSSANDGLEKYLDGGNVTDPNLVAVKAELLTIRGIAYYYLVNLYQHTYKGNETAPGVPLILSSKDKDKPRATVQEVYNQIIADLTFGAEHGVYTPQQKKDADAKVAAAYLAKAYAAMENWSQVEKYARMAINGVSFSLPGNFYKVDNADVLWGTGITAETSDIYASFFSHMDNTIPGYAGGLGIYKKIHNKLYEKMSSKDARRLWFVVDGIYKPDEFVNFPDYTSLKFNSIGDFSGDYIYLRSADPYLLLVEALAEQGKTADAMSELKKFLASRGTADEVDNHAADLIDYIRLQRRIELWGEGSTFFDFKRWKLPINRSVAGTNHRTKKDFPAGAPELIYQIPKREIEQNPNLEQNP